jgi:hypothetical protein
MFQRLATPPDVLQRENERAGTEKQREGRRFSSHYLCKHITCFSWRIDTFWHGKRIINLVIVAWSNKQIFENDREISCRLTPKIAAAIILVDIQFARYLQNRVTIGSSVGQLIHHVTKSLSYDKIQISRQPLCGEVLRLLSYYGCFPFIIFSFYYLPLSLSQLHIFRFSLLFSSFTFFLYYLFFSFIFIFKSNHFFDLFHDCNSFTAYRPHKDTHSFHK